MTEVEDCRPEIGHLVFRDSGQPGVGSSYPILANDLFHVGRELVQQALGVEDRCISKHHLKIHCVKYEDDDEKVAPMVWARVLSNNSIIFRRNGLDDEDGGIPLSREHGAFLLNEGDSIQLTSNIWVDFELPDDVRRSDPPQLDTSQCAEIPIFAHRYRLTTRVLGFGGYAAVYVANDERTGKQVACKIVKQPDNLDEDHELRLTCRATNESVAREFNILKALSHPNIMALEAVYCTPYNVYIFQDLITGGDLMSHVQRTGRLSEAQAAIILRQLLEAVKYLHAHGIVHRDIKPENILVTSWKDGGRIVLTDFGQSRPTGNVQNTGNQARVSRMQTLVGTVGYCAPEIVRLRRQTLKDRGDYSKAVDIWSVGCVACAMLGSDVLFPNDGHDTVSDLTKEDYDNRMYTFEFGEDWAHLGRRAKGFIKGCLNWDEEDRLTAMEALAHEWFTHRHYRAEMDAAYKRAIADWQPKKYNDEDLIQEINTAMHVERAAAKRREEVRSKHFPPFTSATVLAHQQHSGPTEQASQLARFRAIEKLNASPLVPASSSSAQAHREEPVDDSVPYPPGFDHSGDHDEFDDDCFQEWTAADYDGLEMHPAKKVVPRAQADIGSFPMPPPFMSRTIMTR
ncbi:hypothetical protein CKM354_001050600 [Cercospora kikuchii]|uniref:Protein kinase domain-containing protein n=1 Tax=Cercospora kikuchii TaxID=84275 RepID=A0A9P3FKW5_9PEZI|nr:uncharacterized protein CKM354_001050600 [Cercospora kikuchii]GIZ47415.1 hypothetical protein CKM354_001050600 [Cercospora kikuchii]